MTKNTWQGFDNRIFLTPTEWETYKRRPPVRFSAMGFTKSSVCSICGHKPTDDNPLQLSHRIPFIKGVVQFGLTPNYLDRRSNLQWAHRKQCNKSVELSDREIEDIVSTLRRNFYPEI